jgi:hypothetical protein
VKGGPRKTNRLSSCHVRSVGLLFHARRRGNPAADPDGGCGAAKATPKPRCGYSEPLGNQGHRGRSEDRTGILRDRRAVVRAASLTTRKSFSETRRGGLRTVSGLRTAPPEASADGTPPIGVGSPARHRMDESPERVEASANAPSGLSRWRVLTAPGAARDSAAEAGHRSLACGHALPREVAQSR